MKLSGTGRIVLWRGGSLWIGRVGEQTGSHLHHAVQITLGLSGAVRFREPGRDWTRFHAALIPAHQPHMFDAPGEMAAHVFAEPESREGRVLQQRHRGGVQHVEAGAARRAAEGLRALFEHRAADAALVEAGRALIRELAGSAQPERPLDPRIARVIERVRERLDEAVRLGDIAASVHLSPERFRHLFVEQTGMRFRPYVLWLRLERAVESYAAGDSLTAAAQAGGFADSAHLSRTFRRMFGVAPASLEVE